MFPWNPSQWTEQYLLTLIGQPESGRLEFKSGKALAKREDKDKFVRDQLSPAVSAFANSEGGILVIGIDEDRVIKPRIANQLDGITIGAGNAIESPEQFQQLLDSCISPFLPGLSARRVVLSGDLQGRVALVVYVPQGNTAYQARDHRYYSRSEFETRSMPDHEVRLRMQRGRTPQARVELVDVQCVTAEQEFEKRSSVKQDIAKRREAGEILLYGRGIPTREEIEAPKRDFDEYEFKLAVVNTGELTIRDFVLSCRVVNVDGRATLIGEQSRAVGVESRFRFTRVEGAVSRGPMPEYKLFTTDRLPFPEQAWSLQIASGGGLSAESLIIEWTLYLDDTAPNRGTIDLGLALNEARHAADNS